ncbi:sol narae metalloprotease isoform X2 [Arctopsyche grandis]
MWTVVGNDTQPHGVEFVETEMVGDEAEHIGETYQDEETQAALVIRRDPKAGLLVEGSIGHDLVIKPLPSTLSSSAVLPKPSKALPPDQDDEMFMDPNQDDMVSIDTGLPIKRSKTVAKTTAGNYETDDSSTVEAEEATTTSAGVYQKGINKMDDEGVEVVFDDDRAKEEARRQTKESGVKVKAVNVRSALIEALEGAKHVVYKRDVAEDTHEELSDYAFMEPDRLQKRFNSRRKRSSSINDTPKIRSKREAPYVIYPEILVIVDYDGYRLHGGDNLQIKRYFVSFWNGVDLRYKLLKGPKIRISIAGIIISRGRDATPYLERNRVGRDAIDSAAALTDMGKYLFRERRLPVYDIAVAVTKYDMCRRRKGGRCTKGTAGFAYVGGACVVNKRLEKVNSVAIIEDTGGFSGIIVAAHEVGHLLGAVHDGSPPPSYLGGPGAEKCRWEDGFIMSDLRHTEKGFRWSPCSVLSFHHFLNGDTATCLYNSPHEDESLPRVLPGKLLSLDAQCRKDRGTSACFKDERVCAQLFCFDAGSGYCVAYRPAAEGSPCGDGQYCINGRCVAEHENIIPDYSHHTPSYIRRDTSPYYGNDTIHRLFQDQTTQAYGTYPSNPYQQNYYYPSTGQSPLTIAQPLQNPYNPSSPISYENQHTTQNPYPVQYNTVPITRHSFSYNPYYSTTRNPYDFRNFQVYQYTAETKQTQYTVPSTSEVASSSTETTSTTTSTSSPYFLRFSFSSTKNPYDFKEFATKRPVSKSTLNETSTLVSTSTASTASSTPSTEKPKFGFFSKLDFRNYFNRTTTKNPYDFDLSNYKEIPNNNIKRSYSIGSYYGSQNRHVANVASPNETMKAEESSHTLTISKNPNATLALNPPN